MIVPARVVLLSATLLRCFAGEMNPTSWSISFECDTARVRPDVLDLVRGHLEEMGPALTRIPEESPFWISLRESGMSMDVGGWRFKFRVNHQGATCVEIVPALPP